MRRVFACIFTSIIVSLVAGGGCVKINPFYEEVSRQMKETSPKKKIQLTRISGLKQHKMTSKMLIHFYKSLKSTKAIKEFSLRGRGGALSLDLFMSLLTIEHDQWGEKTFLNDHDQHLALIAHGVTKETSMDSNTIIVPREKNTGQTVYCYSDFIGLALETSDTDESLYASVEFSKRKGDAINYVFGYFVTWMQCFHKNQSDQKIKPFGYELVYLCTCVGAPPDMIDETIKYEIEKDSVKTIHTLNKGLGDANTFQRVKDRYGFFWRCLLQEHGVVIACKEKVFFPDAVEYFFCRTIEEYVRVRNERLTNTNAEITFGNVLGEINKFLKLQYPKYYSSPNPWVAYRLDSTNVVLENEVTGSYNCFSRADGLSTEPYWPLFIGVYKQPK